MLPTDSYLRLSGTLQYLCHLRAKQPKLIVYMAPTALRVMCHIKTRNNIYLEHLFMIVTFKILIVSKTRMRYDLMSQWPLHIKIDLLIFLFTYMSIVGHMLLTI